jgi:hypothetical protein
VRFLTDLGSTPIFRRLCHRFADMPQRGSASREQHYMVPVVDAVDPAKRRIRHSFRPMPCPKVPWQLFVEPLAKPRLIKRSQKI